MSRTGHSSDLRTERHVRIESRAIGYYKYGEGGQFNWSKLLEEKLHFFNSMFRTFAFLSIASWSIEACSSFVEDGIEAQEVVGWNYQNSSWTEEKVLVYWTSALNICSLLAGFAVMSVLHFFWCGSESGRGSFTLCVYFISEDCSHGRKI